MHAFMKNMFLKYASALLAVWYCLSIIGFDVHSCNTTGSIFVNSVLSGTSCDDIHPEHDCAGHGSCCSSHSCCDHEKAEDNCCTNEIEVLDCESVIVSDDDACIIASYTLDYTCSIIELDLLPCFRSAQVLYYPDPGEYAAPDHQAVLSIWRI